eukprot:2464000-Rhodomonas_salina.6
MAGHDDGVLPQRRRKTQEGAALWQSGRTTRSGSRWFWLCRRAARRVQRSLSSCRSTGSAGACASRCPPPAPAPEHVSDRPHGFGQRERDATSAESRCVDRV